MIPRIGLGMLVRHGWATGYVISRRNQTKRSSPIAAGLNAEGIVLCRRF